MEQEFQIGAITTTHGLRGEVKVFPTTDDPEKFRKLKKVILRTDKLEMEIEIEGVKYFKNMIILKFKGIEDINEVEKYRGATLWIKREDAIKLKKDEYYRADLLNLDVYDDTGEKLGVLIDILDTAANDVYVVKTLSNKEVLLPAIKECIKEVSIENNRMVVHIMDGLLD